MMLDVSALSHAELDEIAVRQEAGAGERMMAAVEGFLGRFVAYPSEHARVAHALWIVHTHLMDRWESTPRIAFLSAEPASGKTRALEVTELLVPHPVCAVNVSPAYLFRKVGGEDMVTILFDEIDTVFGPKAKENEEIRGLLNAGHRRTAVAGRCVVRGKEILTEEIPAYAAVALAGLGWLPDTILSRSVIVRMRRRHEGERVEQFRSRIHSPQGAVVRSLIEVWARDVEIEWPDLPTEIQDRNADMWESLLAIADAVGGDWPERARKAAVTLVTAATDAEPSLGLRLLGDLRAVFGEAGEMSSKAILADLVEMEEAPWANLRGRPLDERGLAQRLKQYGIRSKVMWLGAKQARGYSRADLHDAWARYLLPQSPATSVTSVTSVAARTVTDVTDVTHFPAHGGGDGSQCAHCGQPGELVECEHGADQPARLHKACIASWTSRAG
jgi:Protein of unknown function (DUF3631)